MILLEYVRVALIHIIMVDRVLRVGHQMSPMLQFARKLDCGRFQDRSRYWIVTSPIPRRISISFQILRGLIASLINPPLIDPGGNLMD